MRIVIFSIIIGVLCGCDDSHEAPEKEEELKPSYYFMGTLKDQTQTDAKTINVKYNESTYSENVFVSWGYGTQTSYPEYIDFNFSTEYRLNGLNSDHFNITFSMHELKVDIDSVNHTYIDDAQMLNKFNHRNWQFLYSQISGYDRGVIISYDTREKRYFNFKNTNGDWFDEINNDESHYFTLDSIGSKFDKIHGDGFIVAGTFECVLYNYENPSDSIIITNGAFKGFISRKGT